MPIYFLVIEFVSFIDFLLGPLIYWPSKMGKHTVWTVNVVLGANNPLGFREDNNSLKGK